MNKILSIVAAMLLTLSGVAQSADQKMADQNLSFATVITNLDLRSNTKLHVKEYWKSIQNQQVTWSGEVYDVKAGHGSRVKIMIADKTQPIFKGYNIVITTTDIEKAANVKKGQRIKFSGTLSDHKLERAGAVLEVTNAQLL
jgi:hypothetical protein